MDWEVARKFVIPLAILFVWMALGWVIQKVVSVSLRKAAQKTATKWDDIVVRSLRGVVFVWFLLSGVEIALKTVSLPKEAAGAIDKGISILAIFSVVLFIVRVTSGLVSHYFDRQTEIPTSIIRNISSAVIYVVGFLVILDFLGVAIAPILTALGVGALAVALALQDTLSNLFAGVHILLSNKIRRGDYIKLENGDEGVVADISWRNVTIHALSNNLVIVPNSKVASSIVTNYHLPDAEVAVLVNLGVCYDCDLRRVEKVTTEVAAEVMRDTPGGLPGFQPFLRFNKLAESSVNFTVILRGRQYTDQYLITHEFIKRLLERYRVEGIEVPFPIRKVLLRHEPGEPAPPKAAEAR